MDNIDFNYLLEKKSAEEFLHDHSKEIFGSQKKISLIEIKNTPTYNVSACNVLYRINVDNQEVRVRLSSSKTFNKKQDYLVLKYFYENGFDEGSILVSKPLVFFEEKNLYLYEDAPGETFKQKINNSLEQLESYTRMSAKALLKIHELKKPPLDLWYSKAFFNMKKIEDRADLLEYYGKFADSMDENITKIKTILSSSMKQTFCHGDFQPDNLIINADTLYVIDVTLACLADPEFDLAHFVNQLGMMLYRFGDISHFEKLKDQFLATYGDYDKKKFQLYSVLSIYKTLEVYRLVKEKRYLDFAYELLEKNIKVLD